MRAPDLPVWLPLITSPVAWRKAAMAPDSSWNVLSVDPSSHLSTRTEPSYRSAAVSIVPRSSAMLSSSLNAGMITSIGVVPEWD